MKRYILILVLALCAISALAVALLGGSSEQQPVVTKEIPWEYNSMRSICYMSVECLTTDFSPVQESIYANRLMYGELPMSFLLTVEAPQVADSIAGLSCLVECSGVKMEAELKELQVENREGKTLCSGVFVKNLSPLAKELGEPMVMDMIKAFPKGVKISVKTIFPDNVSTDYVVVKK